MTKDKGQRAKVWLLRRNVGASEPFTFSLSPFPSACKRGFTLLETLIALTVLALLATFIVSGLSAYRESAALDQAVDEALELLREARAKTMAGENLSSYGVHFATTSVTLFKGGVYNPGDAANMAVALPGTVTVSVVNLSTTTASVVFARLSGEAGATGTVTFVTSRSAKSKRIEILSSGLFLKL